MSLSWVVYGVLPPRECPGMKRLLTNKVVLSGSQVEKKSGGDGWAALRWKQDLLERVSISIACGNYNMLHGNRTLPTIGVAMRRDNIQDSNGDTCTDIVTSRLDRMRPCPPAMRMPFGFHRGMGKS